MPALNTHLPNEIFEVKAILCHDVARDLYLVQWDGGYDQSLTWEPKANLTMRKPKCVYKSLAHLMDVQSKFSVPPFPHDNDSDDNKP